MAAVVLLVVLLAGTADGAEPVGRGARLFVTKCYGGRGRLGEADFRQLADAGFTVLVNRWRVDVPAYCRGAGAVGLDVMTWRRGLAITDDAADQVVTREGRTTRYRTPCSPEGWAQVTRQICEEAEACRPFVNLRGTILDMEIYDRNKTDGFCESYDDASFAGFFRAIGRPVPDPLPEPERRRAALNDLGLLSSFVVHQYRLVAARARRLRQAVDAVNPYFQIGVYGWGVLSEAVLEQVATLDAPALELNAMTYGRSIFSRAFAGGYDGTRPDRVGLKWSLTTVAGLARRARERPYPVVLLGGHSPQTPGPVDGTQYAFTVRQSFNSAACADGYWIWTDWKPPQPWPSRQAWIDAMMQQWHAANTALDAGDFTWASRQPDLVPDPEATAPLLILTRNADRTTSWDPIAGRQVSIERFAPQQVDWTTPSVLNGSTLVLNGADVETRDPETGAVQKRFRAGRDLCDIAVGDVDGIHGLELVTLNSGWIRIWDPDSLAPLLRFRVGDDQVAVTVSTAPVDIDRD